MRRTLNVCLLVNGGQGKGRNESQEIKIKQNWLVHTREEQDSTYQF